ncbi:Y+L amino acid transporter, partial [Ascosphaera atra]
MHTVNPWASKGIAIGALLSIVVINSLSTRLGTRMTNAFMFFKFVALLGVMIIGIVVAATGTSYEGKANKDWKDKGWFSETSHDPSRWAVALYAGLWAFEGWDNTNYVTGEFKNPSRDLPRVIHTSMPLVILLFVMANVSYFFVLPIATIEETNTIGVQFGRKAFGPIGAAILALVVSGSCYGSLNATMFTSGRLIYAAGREGYLPAFVGRLGL